MWAHVLIAILIILALFIPFETYSLNIFLKIVHYIGCVGMGHYMGMGILYYKQNKE